MDAAPVDFGRLRRGEKEWLSVSRLQVCRPIEEGQNVAQNPALSAPLCSALVKAWVQRSRQLLQKSEGADDKTKRKMLGRENGVFLVIAGRMTSAGLVSVKKQRLACTPVARGR